MTYCTPGPMQWPSWCSLGASVKMHSLQTRSDLNGKIGVVHSVDAARGRVGICIHGDQHPVAIKPSNLQPLTLDAVDNFDGTNASRMHQTDVSLHSEFCLARCMVLETISFYYAFGNTPPTYVLHDVRCSEQKSVLLLASGDVRSALYSLARDAQHRTAVWFLVSDCDRYVIARNALLLWLGHHAPSSHVFAVWFSLGLSSAAAASLKRGLNALTGPNAAEELAGIGISFLREDDRKVVEDVLKQWMTMRLEWNHAQAMRSEVLLKHLKAATAEQRRDVAKKLASCQLMLHMLANSAVPEETFVCELAAYFDAGIITAPGEDEHSSSSHLVNVTLFRSATKYDLHYGTYPFLAFPLYSSEYSADRPFASLCFREFESWLAELKLRQSSVQWTLAVADCLHLCSMLVPQQFDIVATSNVADHVGLLPLLQAARMVTKPSGCLITSTLLHLSYAKDLADYLRMHLILDPEQWPGVLGWRCVGREGDLAPVSSQIQLQMPKLDAMYARETGAGKVRSEEVLMWTPAEESNLPLLAVGAVAELVAAVRLVSAQSVFGYPFVPPLGDKYKFVGLNRLHLPTLLPILLLSRGAEECLQDADHEIRDLLGFWRGERELVVASLPLTDEAIGVAIEPQPHLAVFLETVKYGTLLYSGLWLRNEGGQRLVGWLVDPAKLAGAKALLVGGSFLSPILAKATGIVGKPCKRPASNIVDWLHASHSDSPWASAALFDESQPLARAEAKDGTRVVISLPCEWWRRVEAGEVPKLLAAEISRGIRVGFDLESTETATDMPFTKLALKLCFPTQVEAAACEMQLSRKRRELTLVVRRAAYDFGSSVPAELCLDDFCAWQEFTHFEKPFLGTLSGLQLSEEEGFISRTQPGKDTPALTALKETVAYFFQKRDAGGFQLVQETPGVVALVAHHGLRREHRYGTVAADLSFCFLTHSILEDVVRWWLPATADRGMPNICCEAAEYAMLQQFVRLLAGRAKDTSSWRALPKGNVVPAKLRRHFVRVLFPPLFALDAAQLVSARLMSNRGETLDPVEQLLLLKELKEEGAQLVRQRRHAEAVHPFRRAVAMFAYTQGSNVLTEGEMAAATQIAAQCCLNIALCLLELKDLSKSSEVVACCNYALQLLKQRGDCMRSDATSAVLVAKAHYRIGLAREMKGDTRGAGAAFVAAMRAKPGDHVVEAAMARMRL